MKTRGSSVCWLVAACLVMQLVSAAEDQQRQVTLEDIERDNLNSAKERQLAQQRQQQLYAQQQVQPVAQQQQQQVPLGYAQLAELQQQQHHLFSPATLQQLAAAYQPQAAQHIPAAAAAQSPQLSGQQLLYVSPTQAQQLQLQAQRQLLGGSAGAGLPVSAFYHAQQQPAAAALQYQPAAAVPGAALGAAYTQQYLQQFAQAPVVNIPAPRAQFKVPAGVPAAAGAQQQLYLSPEQLAQYQQYQQPQPQQLQYDYSALLQQQQQQQQQLQQQQQQLRPDYNALAQQQVQQQLKAAHVKSTAAPPPKQQQQQQSQSGFVPIQAPTLRHPGRGVSFSHYRQGA